MLDQVAAVLSNGGVTVAVAIVCGREAAVEGRCYMSKRDIEDIAFAREHDLRGDVVSDEVAHYLFKIGVAQCLGQ